jgi:hypothetical protein
LSEYQPDEDEEIISQQTNEEPEILHDDNNKDETSKESPKETQGTKQFHYKILNFL